VSTVQVWKAVNACSRPPHRRAERERPKGMADKVKADLVSQQPLLAPVSAGQRVGTLRVMLESKLIGEYPWWRWKTSPWRNVRPRLGYDASVAPVTAKNCERNP